VLRIAARHPQAKALRFLQKECSSAGTSMAAGTRSTFSGRVDIQSLIRVLPFVVHKSEAPLVLSKPAGDDEVLPQPEEGDTPLPTTPALAGPIEQAPHDAIEVPLVRVAVARSGDKGDDENIGVIARDAKWLPYLRHQLTPEAVRQYFSHLVEEGVDRYEVPGLLALNFVLHGALGGGGVSSLRSDPLGKSFAQMLLDFPVRVPSRALERV
jgi:hypothetical protein